MEKLDSNDVWEIGLTFRNTLSYKYLSVLWAEMNWLIDGDEKVWRAARGVPLDGVSLAQPAFPPLPLANIY